MIIDDTGKRGCDHCHGPIMTTISSRAGRIELCWDHTLDFTGWTSEQLEERMAPFEDHLLAAFKRGIPADKEDTKQWLEVE